MIDRPLCKIIIPLTGLHCGKPAAIIVGTVPVCAACALLRYVPAEPKARPEMLRESYHGSKVPRVE